MKHLFYTLLLFTLNADSNAQDWPNLERYSKENAKLSKPDSTEDRIVFLGNSITEGWSGANPEFFKGKSYINRGISGQTSPQMLLRFRADVVNLQPKVVVISAGTNDIAGNTGPSTLETIFDNIKSMCEIAYANRIKVIIASVLPAFDFPWKPGLKPADKITSLNTMLKKYAHDNKHIYLDYHSAMADEKQGLKEEYTYDGVHPNKSGYSVMEPLVETAIKTALSQ